MNIFELAMPWWEFLLRAVAVYAVLLVMLRLSGKRSVGQFTPFDMVLLILLGTAVQNSLIGEDVSLLGGLLLAATLIALNSAVGWLVARSPRIHRIVEGLPVQFIADGQLDRGILRKQRVSELDLQEALRRAGMDEVSEARSGWIETDGRISLIRRRDSAG